MRRVLLLNPPAQARYIRDQFCSHRSKGAYYWQPLDLLVLSGQLDAAGFEVRVIDAIVENLSPAAVVSRVAAATPEAVVFLTASDTFAADVDVIASLKRAGVATAVGIGDILRDHGARLLAAHPVIDACLNDFVTHGLIPFLEGRTDEAVNMIVCTPDGIRAGPAPSKGPTFTVPPPRYDLFPLDRYRMPFNRHHPYAAVITSNWCPFRCTFCPFAGTPFRVRDIDNVLENLRVVHDMGIRQVHFADWTFAVNRRHTERVLTRMMDAGLHFDWSCLSRVDLVDRPLLELFKSSGCHLVEFGVESGSQMLLDRYQKQITVAQVREAFGHCGALGISTLATFVLGLPGETPTSLDETLALALDIDATYCSFNVASPRMGTPLRRDAIAAGTVDEEAHGPLDSSWSVPVFSEEQLPAAELDAFRRHAIRAFFFRPSYVWKRIRQTTSVVELTNHATNAIALAWQNWRGPTRRASPAVAPLAAKPEVTRE